MGVERRYIRDAYTGAPYKIHDAAREREIRRLIEERSEVEQAFVRNKISLEEYMERSAELDRRIKNLGDPNTTLASLEPGDLTEHAIQNPDSADEFLAVFVHITSQFA